jgi:hypothetical protein
MSRCSRRGSCDVSFCGRLSSYLHVSCLGISQEEEGEDPLSRLVPERREPEINKNPHDAI